MEIIANTSNGVLIKATTAEIESIINAVTGIKPEKILIGQKNPGNRLCSYNK